nr:hypothetical protein [Tanacetum cinerariifolium]
MALPDKHQFKFNSYKDAKTLMKAIEKRFEGNTKTKKVQKTLLKQQYKNFIGSSSESLDQIHDRLQKLVSQLEIHGVTTEPVSVAASVFVICAKLHVSSLPNVDSLSNAVIYLFFASQSFCPQLDNEDLKQIDADDLKEMDLKWQMAMLTMRARRFLQKIGRNLGENGPTSMGFDMSKVECYNCHRKGHFARDCRSPKDLRRNEEEPTNYALMAFSSSSSSFDNESDKSWPPSSLYDRFQSSDGYHVVPPPCTGTFMPPKPNLVFNNAPNGVETDHSSFTIKLSPTKPDQDLSLTNRSSTPIIEDYVSDFEDEFETKTPQIVTSFVQSTEQVKSPRPSVQHVETSIPTATPKLASPKPISNSKRRNRKACFMCKSLDHLIKDCDYHEKKMAQPSARNHATRGNHKHYAPLTHQNPQRHMVYAAVLTQSKPVPITAVKPVSTAVLKFRVTRPRHDKPVVTKFNSPTKPPINHSQSLKTSISPPKVTAIKAPVGNPHHALKDKGVIDNGCSRNMTGNMSYLSDFEELNGGYVAFGGKFDGKVDEGFLVGHSVSSKAFRVFNHRTRIVQETLHVNFLKNKPNVTGSGPTWLFNIDNLTKTMNFQPVTAGNQSNPSAGFQDKFDAEKTEEEGDQQYVLFLVWSSGSVNPQNTDGDAAFDEKEHEFDEKKPESEVNVSPSSSAQSKKQDDKTKREVNAAGTLVPTVGQISPNSTNTFSTDGPLKSAASPTHGKSSFIDASQLPDDHDMPELEEITYFDDEDDVGAEADFNNLETSITVSLILTTRVHKDHHVKQIIGDVSSATQTRKEPKRVHYAFKDPSWIEAMQKELLQFKMQKVWILVDLPYGKRDIAYASFMGFMVYQMDVKSAFMYGTIKEKVYVCQPLGFEDPDHPDKVYKVVKALYGLHQALRAWYETLDNYLLENGFQRSKIDQTLFIKRQKAYERQVLDEFNRGTHILFGSSSKEKKDGIFISQDKYVTEILRKFRLTEGKAASTPIDIKKPFLKDPDGEDVDVHTYISMISSLMYLTSSRPDIMFAVCACAHFQVTPKASHLHVVKRIFRYIKGKPHLGLWYPKDSPFDLVAYLDSDYAGVSLDRKLTTGGCQFLGCRLISWHCKKQTVVATSSTEAKYVAATRVNTPISDKDRLELLELTVFLLPKVKIVGIGVSAVDLQVSAVRLMLLLFAETHNMAAYLTKSDASEGFHHIIDFLNGSSIKYALTVPEERDADENVENINAGDTNEGDVSTAHDEFPNVNEEPSIPSPTPPTPLPQPSQDIPSTSQGRMIVEMDQDVDVVLEDDKEVVDDAIADQDAKVDESADIQGRQAESQAEIYKCLYGRKCRSPVIWTEIGESQLIGSKIVPETTEKIFQIKERLKTAKSRQKSYADKRLKPLEFKVGDRVLLKVAYRLKLPQELSCIHDTFHVSNLKKYLAESDAQIPLEEIKGGGGGKFWQPLGRNKGGGVVVSWKKTIFAWEGEVQEVVDVATTAKIITKVITAASETIIAASKTITIVEAQVLAITLTTAHARVTAAPSKRRKGVVIRDPQEESTTSTIIPTETESKDKGKGILVEEPKPLKKQQQIKQDEKYARELEAELNRTIDYDEVIDHVKKKAKEDHYVKRYQAIKRKPQTEAQTRKNMMVYLKNVAGFKMDYFKGMSYDDIRLVFEKHFDSNVAFLLKIKEQIEEEESRALKRLNEIPAKKAAKRRKLDEDVEELKRHLQIVPNEDDDVYTEATPLARKVPVVDFEIINLNNKPYFKIIRADGTHQLYVSFLSLLRNFDREDLEALWVLVKERFATTKPKNFSDDFLLMTLGAMFEMPNIHA